MTTLDHDFPTGIESWKQGGGDFLVWRRTAERSSLFLGDPTGHDEMAADMAAWVRPMIADEIGEALSEDRLRRWHRCIHRRFRLENRFVCFTALQLDFTSQVLTIINGGNPGVLVHRGASQHVEHYASTGMPLGMVDDSEWIPPPAHETLLGEKDFAMCVTDGVLDCMDSGGRRFGLHRMRHAMRQSERRSPLDGLRRRLMRFSPDRPDRDDLSIVVLHGAQRQVA